MDLQGLKYVSKVDIDQIFKLTSFAGSCQPPKIPNSDDQILDDTADKWLTKLMHEQNKELNSQPL